MTVRRAQWSDNDHAERTKMLRNNINSLNKRIAKYTEEMALKEVETKHLKV